MSSLTRKDQFLFEQLFGMNTGYVLNFTDATFQDFVYDSTAIDIFGGIYVGAGSKAKRLRLFWKKENDYRTQKLLSDLLSYWFEQKELDEQELTKDEERLYEKCKNAIDVLRDNSVLEDIDTFSNVDVFNSASIQLLIKEIKDKLHENKPELALDRLHTFSVRFFRQVCEKYNLPFVKNDGLQKLMSNYRNFVEASGLIKSEMTIGILKTNISILNNFNNVRNDKSYAHDNEILNKSESKLICNHVISLLKFIDEIDEVLTQSLHA